MLILFHLLLLVSCATQPQRQIASEQVIVLGEVNASKSKIKLHQTNLSQNDYFHFYLELRDARSKLVDVDLKDIRVRNQKNQLDSFVKRLSKGRYEVTIPESLADLSKIKFFVQKKVLPHKLVANQKPVRAHSKLELISQGDHVVHLRLTLRDKASLPLETELFPDIILEGLAEVSELRLIKKGVWEFSLAYPEQNQIFYLSIRANEVLLERLFRFQHLEK